MKRVLAISLVAAMLAGLIPNISFAASAASDNIETEIYVSSTGSSNGDGSKENPFHTMGEAKAKVRTLNQNMQGDIVVYFDDGEYFVDETYSFTSDDSAANDHQIIYKGKDGTKPVFTSGKVITGWDDAGDEEKPGLMAADASAIENTRQLYVDGELATRARGYLKGNIARGGEKIIFTTYLGSLDAYRGYQTDYMEMLNWRNPQNIEFVYDISWAHRIVPIDYIEKISENELYINMHWDSFRMSQIGGGVHANLPSYIENAYELLDEPGEWYFDEAEKKVYYMPKKGQDMNKIESVIPSVEQFITLFGEPDDKVKNITFDGLTFKYSTWLYPSTNGWPEQQANFAHDPRENFNMHAYSMIPQAAIETKMAEGITFTRCDFNNLGSAAINILEGSVGNTVEQSVFREIAAGGVLVGGVSITDAHPFTSGTIEDHEHDTRYIVKDNTITNNYFNEIGTEYKGSIAIIAGYTDHTVITHNSIRNVAYSGISVGWGWGYWDCGGWDQNIHHGEGQPLQYPVIALDDPAVSRNNVIEYNEVTQTMMKLHDGGGIYTLGDMPNTSIKGNVIHDIVGWPGGLYLDQGSGGMTVENNITYNTQMEYFHNERWATWGFRMDPPAFKQNYWNVSPDKANFPHDIAANAGIQEQYQSILPKELNKMTAPEFIESGDKVILEGRFGEEPGRVVLTGVSEPVYVSADSGNMISWTDESIVFRTPGGVISGPVYVECADKTETNKNKRLIVGNFTKELFKDDFEAYVEGGMKNQAEAVLNYTSIPDRVSITRDSDNSNIMQMTTNWGDTVLTKEADWKDILVMLDFRFDADPRSFGGVYISPRYQDSGNKYLAEFLPHYSDGVMFQQYVGGNLQVPGSGRFSYKTDTWYRTKVAMVGNEMRVKVWQRNMPEPVLWTALGEFSGIDKGGFMLQFTDFNEGQNPLTSYDNLWVLEYEEGVTIDLSEDQEAPVTYAVITGKLKEKGVYSSQVTLELKSQEEGSGVADIVYKINGGNDTNYSDALLITRDGNYDVTFFAADRAGNKEAEKTIHFSIEQEQDTILFEEGFEDYESGKLTDLSKGYKLTHPDLVEIIEDNELESNVLKINGQNGQAVRLIKADSWENTTMTFDFKYARELTDYAGVYVSNYFQSYDPDNMYHYPIIPKWGGIHLQQNVGGNAQGVATISTDTFNPVPDTWFSVKMQTAYDFMAFKIWLKGGQEPEEWMAEGKVNGLSGGGGLQLSFTNFQGENYALFDNIVIMGIEQDFETDTAVYFDVTPENPQVKVFNKDSQLVEQEEDGSYLLAKGDYTYTITSEGYKEFGGQVSVAGGKTMTIQVELQRISGETPSEGSIKALKSLILKAEALNSSSYTKTSWDDMQIALQIAKTIFEKVDATDVEVRKAAENLEQKITQLKTIPVTKPSATSPNKSSTIKEIQVTKTYPSSLGNAADWRKDDFGWWLISGSTYAKSEWKLVDGKWYYFDSSGYMAVGWRQLDNGNWYYLKDNGDMAIGWVLWNGNWYYLKDNGSMSVGWLFWNGNWYYLNSAGDMTVNDILYKDVTYKFNSSGACINP